MVGSLPDNGTMKLTIAFGAHSQSRYDWLRKAVRTVG